MKKKRLVIKQTNPLGVLLLILFALAFIMGIVLLFLSVLANRADAGDVNADIKAQFYSVDSSKELMERLDTLSLTGILYIPQKGKFLLKSFPKDFKYLPVNIRKRLFIEAMIPIALTVKEKLDAERMAILRIKGLLDSKLQLSDKDMKFLNMEFKRYGTNELCELIKRVDSVPISIVIAQAGIESGWGSSRYAIQYNNLFGLHKRSVKPYKTIIRRFDSIYQAALAYVKNINISYAYKTFRDARYMMSDKKNPYRLAEYLTMYSIKRDQYIKLIQGVISSNMLSYYDTYNLNKPYFFLMHGSLERLK